VTGQGYVEVRSCQNKVSGCWETFLSGHLNSHNALCFAVKFSKLRSDSMTPSLFDMDDEEPDVETYSKLYGKVRPALCPPWKSGSGTSLMTGQQIQSMRGTQCIRVEISESCIEMSQRTFRLILIG
jgi:hypothetical protein